MSKEEFIQEVTKDLLPPPAYFPQNVKLNKEGYKSIDEVLTVGLTPLSPAAFDLLANETGALMLDVRSPSDFATGHIPNSIFIGLDGSFAPWVGELIVDVKQPIMLVVEEGREQEAVTRLSRVGFDHALGFLSGGFDAWKEAGKETDTVASVPAAELEAVYENHKEKIFDVRKHAEYLSEHVLAANHTPLGELNDHLAKFPATGSFYIHCAGGYRSMIASSILKSRGYHNLIDVQGGYKAIKGTSIPKSDFVCPSTL